MRTLFGNELLHQKVGFATQTNSAPARLAALLDSQLVHNANAASKMSDVIPVLEAILEDSDKPQISAAQAALE